MRVEHFDVVTIESGRPGLLRNITNTRQVAERLAGQWPTGHRGVFYNAAVKSCMDFVEGKSSAEDLRNAFIEAAKDANIFVQEGRYRD